MCTFIILSKRKIVVIFNIVRRLIAQSGVQISETWSNSTDIPIHCVNCAHLSQLSEIKVGADLGQVEEISCPAERLNILALPHKNIQSVLNRFI